MNFGLHSQHTNLRSSDHSCTREEPGSKFAFIGVHPWCISIVWTWVFSLWILVCHHKVFKTLREDPYYCSKLLQFPASMTADNSRQPPAQSGLLSSIRLLYHLACITLCFPGIYLTATHILSVWMDQSSNPRYSNVYASWMSSTESEVRVRCFLIAWMIGGPEIRLLRAEPKVQSVKIKISSVPYIICK